MADSTLSTLLTQLERLRWCVFKALLPICVLFLLSYAFVPNIFELFVAPLKAQLDPGQNLIGTGVAEVFFVKLKLAFLAAVVAGSPFVFYQVWALIAPAFGPANKKGYLVGFVGTTSLFFSSGAFFCYRAVLPIAFLYFLEQYGLAGISPEIRVAEYFSFFVRITLAFGVTFQLPVFTFFLVRLGVWDHRFLWHQFRYAVLIIFVLAAVMTPPDIVSQVLLTGPLIMLYVLSIGIAYVFRRAPREGGVEE